MNPRSTDCEADAPTTTPSRRLFKDNAPEFLALHWDGELTKDRYGDKFKVLSVLVSGPRTHSEGKLFGERPLAKQLEKQELKLLSTFRKQRMIRRFKLS